MDLCDFNFNKFKEEKIGKVLVSVILMLSSIIVVVATKRQILIWYKLRNQFSLH